MSKIFLYSIGTINTALGVFHMFFWKLFNWAEELPKISAVNQGILQVANIILILIILYFALMSFIIARHGKIEIYAKSILLLQAAFYLVRLFSGYIFFGIDAGEVAIILICLWIITGSLYLFFKPGPSAENSL